jgi:FkbM family methyltransferase
VKDVSLVHRLVRRLRGSSATADVAHARARVVATRERLERAREDRLEIQQRLAEARGQIELLRAKLRASEDAADRWKREATNHRRRVLSPFVVRDILPQRREQVALRASARDGAVREQRLVDISPAYIDAVAAGVDPNSARKIELEGLSWWVPLRATDPETVKRVVNKEDLPYRALTQTREFSIGGVMLDLGAHDGSTSIPRVVLGDVEAVYCAEPDPLNYRCLVANIVENGLRGFVLPDRIAIGAVNRTGQLFRTKASRGHRVITGRSEDEGELVSIQVRTLDGWVDDLRVDPRLLSFVKSDTQGYELQVLMGAPRLLGHRQIAWQLEFCPALMRLAGSEPRDFIAFVQRHFTHFVDLNADAPGKRRQPIAVLSERLDYVESLERAQTDVIVYCAAAGTKR